MLPALGPHRKSALADLRTQTGNIGYTRCWCAETNGIDGRPYGYFSRGRAEAVWTLNPVLAAALAALVDIEKEVLQRRPLFDQALFV